MAQPSIHRLASPEISPPLGAPRHSAPTTLPGGSVTATAAPGSAIGASPQLAFTEPGASAPARGRRREKGTASNAEQQLLDDVLTLLEAGTSPWRREWEASGGGHHLNLITGRRYQGVNPILLTLAWQARQVGNTSTPELARLPFWCGFAAAKALGLHPRAGCRAVHILRPHQQRRREASEASQSPDSAPPAAEVGSGSAHPSREGSSRGGTWIRYRPVAVFHVSDLEGDGLAELVARRQAAAASQQRTEPERLALAEAVLSRWAVPVDLGGSMACYFPGPDRIQLPARSDFHSPAAFYATWAHEAIHSTGHASRLKRDLSGRLGSGSAAEAIYAREELVAELGAMLIGDRLEIGSDVANHAAYLHHWIALLQESPRLLYQVLSEARRAADLVAPDPTSPQGSDATA